MKSLRIYHRGGEILSGASYTLRTCEGALTKAGDQGYAISLRHGDREVWLAVRGGRYYGPQMWPVELVDATAEQPKSNVSLGKASNIRKKNLFT